ncbi:CidA/LrgA family protein [Neisseria sp. Ec49-e6-T10]|uniref:CidA/LrgA family protein n=1 Tax=Neisseria sp. Ec49-e6-T10 TaxID=3140744 RepID=UPI003EB7E1A1
MKQINQTPKSNFSTFNKNVLVIAYQVIVITLVWLVANWLSNQFLPMIPAGILGMILLLFGFLFCRLPIRWFSLGAYWLLSELLLFFIPAVISVVKYKQLFFQQGVAIGAVILLSTLLVMAVTAVVVDLCYRFEIKARHKYWKKIWVR